MLIYLMLLRVIYRTLTLQGRPVAKATGQQDGPVRWVRKILHKPVLLKEVVKYLNLSSGKKIIDCTFDGGGHSKEILKHIRPGGKILGIEIDKKLFKQVSELIYQNLKISKKEIILINDTYANLQSIVKESDFEGADGILFDLGLSSWHLEESGRGFSFMRNEPLIMRYDDAKEWDLKKPTAAQIVNSYPREKLAKILKEYGEEQFAEKIASNIVKRRKKKRILTTFDLVNVIEEAVPEWYKRRKIHFATKTFQALRIETNNELKNLEAALKKVPGVLKESGRIVLISFHSLEDRIVKNIFREWEKLRIIRILTKKPVSPTVQEIKENPRARSGKLRAAEITTRKS